MKVFLLALLLLVLGVAGMAVSILFKRGGKFPDGEISHNKELRRQGIICAKEEEMRLWRKGRRKNVPAECQEGGCEGCSSLESETERH